MYYLSNNSQHGSSRRRLRHSQNETQETQSTASVGRRNALPPSIRSQESESEEGAFQPLPPKVTHICQCCYEETESKSPAKCNTGKHQFCQSCLRHYVEAFVFGEPYPLRDIPGSGLKALPCLSTQCIEGFLPYDAIENAITDKVWENYQEKVFHLMARAD
jgi:hypothetical protein